ncbi:MAG: hypothetical protein HQL78_04870 [Magnetococcales bacterium]|nr:hypothetical protein [Magnetococcales bacterium]
MAENIFSTIATARFLQGSDDAVEAVSFMELRHAARHSENPISQSLVAALSKNSRLQCDFYRLIRDGSVCCFSRQAAADSGETIHRKTGNYQIRLCPSKVEQKQVYVVIALEQEKNVVPNAMFIFKSGSLLVKKALSSPHDGVIQILDYADSDLVLALKDQETEIYLNES